MPIESNGSAADPRSFLPDEVLADLSREAGEARGLPNAAFTTDAFFALENRYLFSRSWVFAGRASAVSNPGDVEPVEAGGRSLFMTRDADGRVYVFQNVCPHRGARLVVESLRGSPVLTCPYHAWSFELDGTLKGRPHFHGPGQHDRGNGASNGPDEVCLFSVRSALWHDWVFVNLDGLAPAFEDYIRPVAAHFESWDLGQFRFAHYDSFEFECNWKLAVENFMDAYHVFNVHRALYEVYDPEVLSTPGIAGVHMTQWTELVGPSRGLTLDTDGPELPSLSGLDESLFRGQPAVSVFPNVTIIISPGNLEFFLFEPVGPTRCIMHMWFYFVGDASEAAEHAAAREKVYAEWIHLNHEDEGVCRRMQEGRGCDAYDGGRLAPYWDQGTAHLHRQIADALLGREAFARV